MSNSKLKYRKHVRLGGFDYSESFYYFVTICTRRVPGTYQRMELFEPWVDPKYGHELVFHKDFSTQLLHQKYTGAVVEKLNKLSQYYPNVLIDFYVIMPDHLHLIVAITETAVAAAPCAASKNRLLDSGRHTVPQLHQIRKVSLPIIINAFKSLVTRRLKDLGFVGSVFQPNYYEHIIRDSDSLNCIRTYLLQNPEVEYIDINWKNLDPEP